MHSWRPILDDALLGEARAVIDAIGADLGRSYDDWPLTRPGEPSGLRSVSLASGRAGVALFFAYYERIARSNEHESLAARFLNEAIELMAVKTMKTSLFCGFTGIAWTTEHLMRMWDEPAEDDPNDAIDEVLLDYVEHGASQGPYDLIDGLVGIGVYALERYPRPTALVLLERIVDRLDQHALPRAIGRALPSAGPRAPGDGDESAEPFYNLGLSHGNPGVIAFLGLCCRNGIAVRRATRLLEDVVDWLLSQRLPADSPSVFPDHVGRDLEPSPARTAWCYGDPGVAAALLLAARCTGKREWEETALTVAHRAADRPVEDTGIVDAGLCHGAAGVAHIFHRIHQATGDERCAMASRFWFERCLSMRRGSVGSAPPTTSVPLSSVGWARTTASAVPRSIGGFTSFSFERVRDGEFIVDPCWLSGAAGVGLALLAATTKVEPQWDRAMLLGAPHEGTADTRA